MSEPPVDFEALAEVSDTLREVLSVMVKGLVADGFTDDQARALVVFAMTGLRADDG